VELNVKYEVGEQIWILHSEEFLDLYRPPNIVMTVKSRSQR
jgi:hypothetical protein